MGNQITSVQRNFVAVRPMPGLVLKRLSPMGAHLIGLRKTASTFKRRLPFEKLVRGVAKLAYHNKFRAVATLCKRNQPYANGVQSPQRGKDI